MKIAKKVLAAVMALALIAGLSAMAFAAEPQLALVPGEVEDGAIAVAVVFKGSVGLKSWDAKITYDKDVLEYDYADDGSDGAQIADTKSNSFTYEVNPEEDGLINCSGYFKTELTSAADAAADAKKGKTVAINDAAFEAVILYFSVKNADATSTELKVEVTSNSGVNQAGGTFTAKLKDEATPVTPEKPDTKDDEKEDESKPVNPPTGDDKPTGDNMALYAAGAVAILAGAAFIISKKRK